MARCSRHRATLATAFGDIAPALAQYTDEMLFGGV
jgi:hypothetical protein